MSATRAALEAETAAEIVSRLNAFLAEHPDSLLLEAGATLFDLAEAQHTIECLNDRAVLHVWSGGGNQVRRIVSAERRGDRLRLTALRFGQQTPVSLELVGKRGVQVTAPSDDARQRSRQRVERVLRREFPQAPVEGLRASMDLEHSFGPAYVRGLQVCGQRAWAVIAVGNEESSVVVDGILTIGILWLARCREKATSRRIIEGLRLIVPAGMGAATLARLAWMDTRIAKYELYELDAAAETLHLRDPADRGNLATRIAHAPDPAAISGAGGRFTAALPRVLALLPPPPRLPLEQLRSAHRKDRLLPQSQDGFEMRLRSSAELAFLRHGLEFARIRIGFAGGSFNRELEVTIGSGVQETRLTDDNTGAMREMVRELFERRSAPTAVAGYAGDQRDPLFRLQPERWLESLLRADLPALDPHLLPEPTYVQVPAVAGASDRGLLDLLAVTIDHRLAVIEVKAQEDLQLAMQGLDYWIRIREHHLANVDAFTGLSDLQRLGYFPQIRLRSEPPLLYLAAPALRIHPATETILRHFDPRVQWTLIALDERWRTCIRPVWRRRSGRSAALGAETRSNARQETFRDLC